VAIVKLVKWLLSHGADPNICGETFFFTPLHNAAYHGQVEISRILLQHKADQNALDQDGRTLLHSASKQGNIHLARLLLEHGVDVNVQDNERSTALHLASGKSKLEVTRLLLEHGADVGAEEDNSGRTPFQVASGQQRDEITKLLLEWRISQTYSEIQNSTVVPLRQKYSNRLSFNCAPEMDADFVFSHKLSLK
jgi:ankyrin repeat protein